jgi:hypothetical protein
LAFYLPAAEAAKAAAAAAAADREKGIDAPASATYEIPRQRREAELDAGVRTRRETLLARFRKRTADFNALLVNPKLRWEL